MNNYLFKIYELIKFKKNGFPIHPNKLRKLFIENQYWSRERMEKYQLDKLNQLLSVAKNSSDYYADKFNKIKLPLKSINQFRDVTLQIDKRKIIENFENLKTKYFVNKFKHATSGTTGDPLIVYISGLAEVYRTACRIRFRSWWGIKENDKNVYIARKHPHINNSFFNKLKKHLRRRLDIDVFDLNEKTITHYFNEVQKFKPSYIRGYKSGVLEFAELLDKSNLKFENLNLKVVIVTSEVLYENERKFIEYFFNCKVANEYGSVEASIYANECPDGSMHINEETVYIYTNDKNEAIVTELVNDSLPLINYKNDDVIIISEKYCSCGRTSRIIDKVEGRVSGYIVKVDGTKINQVILPIIFMELNESQFKNSVKKFQVIQRYDKFTVRIIPLNNFNDSCKEYIRKRMLEEIGPNIEIKFEMVESIERDKSGKFRIFIRHD